MKQIYNFLTKLLLLILPVVVLLSCSSDPEVEPEPEILDQLEELKADSLKYSVYISPLDTFSNAHIWKPRVKLKYYEGAPIAVNWFVNGAKYDGEPGGGISFMDDSGKMVSFSNYTFDGKITFRSGDDIKVTAFIAGKEYSSSGIIGEKIHQTDLFSVKWGMVVDEFFFREYERLNKVGEPAVLQKADNGSFAFSKSSSFPSFSWAFTYYEITNNQLTQVAEYIPIEINNRALLLNAIDLRARRMGLQDVVVADEQWNLRKEYKWSKGNLNFEVAFTDSPDGRCLGITYTKK